MNACNPTTYTISGFDAMHAALAAPCDPTPLLLAPIGGKTVELDCDGGRLSSDAGLILLKDIDAQLGLTRALATALSDARDARRIRFTPDDLLKQRIFQLPLAMKMRTTPTPYATILSSNSCWIGCQRPVPPWPHSQRYRALKTASHAPSFTAWRWC